MLTLPAAVRIYVAAEAVDLRRGFDGLAAATRSVIGADPLSGHVFVFLNRRKNRVKLLVWDRTGYLLLYNQLHSYYTSSGVSRIVCDCSSCMWKAAAPRSASRFHRLHCLAGTVRPGGS